MTKPGELGTDAKLVSQQRSQTIQLFRPNVVAVCDTSAFEGEGDGFVASKGRGLLFASWSIKHYNYR